MKRHLRCLLLLGITCFLLANTSALAEEENPCDDQTSPEQVRIYFANGMSNDPEEIEENWRALEGLIGVSPNRSFGKSINTKENFFDQM